MNLVGIASIVPEPEVASAPTFSFLYDGIGQNTGNLVFTHAVWSHIASAKKHVEYFRVPEKTNDCFRSLVIPAANWISENPDVDQAMDRIAAWIEELTIPVVVTGLGVQHATTETGFSQRIGSGCRRLLRAVADRSVTMSVRGEYTADVLAELGFRNVRVTGCPSLSMDMVDFDVPDKVSSLALEACVLYPTRYYLSSGFIERASCDRDLFRFGYEQGCTLFMQSEAEEMQYILGFSGGDLPGDEQLVELYGAPNASSLRDYLTQRCRVFFRPTEWAMAARRYAFGFGTRLHGTIMMLNSGVPAVLVTHDSRTQEMADFANIPAIPSRGLELSEKTIQEAYAAADVARYYARRQELRRTYQDFLGENGLATAPEAESRSQVVVAA